MVGTNYDCRWGMATIHISRAVHEVHASVDTMRTEPANRVCSAGIYLSLSSHHRDTCATCYLRFASLEISHIRVASMRCRPLCCSSYWFQCFKSVALQMGRHHDHVDISSCAGNEVELLAWYRFQRRPIEVQVMRSRDNVRNHTSHVPNYTTVAPCNTSFLTCAKSSRVRPATNMPSTQMPTFSLRSSSMEKLSGSLALRNARFS